MRTKKIVDSLDGVLKGLNTAANVVKSTMGANGKTVIIATNDNMNRLKFTKDGVSVAKSLVLEDPIEDIGAQILISAANETVKSVGDGTTLTAVVLQSMINTVYKHVSEGHDINATLASLEKEINASVVRLEKKSKKIKTWKNVKDIAKISSNSDRLGNMFGEIYKEVGLEANINLEKSEISNDTYFDIAKGIELNDAGYVHPAFMTDKTTEQAIFEDAYMHIEEKGVNMMTPLLEALIEEVAIGKRIPLIIMAPKFSDGFIRTCTMNKVNNSVPICLIKTPGYGYGVKKNLDDIRAFLTPDEGMDDTERGGFIDRIVMDPYKSIMYNDDTPFLKERIEQLETLSESAVEAYDERDYKERVHRLLGTNVVVYAGGGTPEALNEEYDRLEDAIGATRSAIRNGYIIGGGWAMYADSANTENDILKKILTDPCIQILKNSNEDVEYITKNAFIDGQGYNVKTRQFEDFYKTGVIDPVNVLVQALKNAFTNTKLLINTSYALYNEYKQGI